MIHLSYSVKRVAAIHDLSGFGRCSLSAAMPVLSVMGLQCCPMPTAVLSSQTGYPGFTCLDFTSHMPGFIDHWQKLGLEFSTIYSGFLGSEGQIDIVRDFIARFRLSGTLVAVDPVMGDNGEKYPTFTDSLCRRMKQLVGSADIVFPNLTEALLLTDCTIPISALTSGDIDGIAREIASTGPKRVIVTGAVRGDRVINYVYDFTQSSRFEITAQFNHKSYSGTGDVFASIVCGGLTLGRGLEASATLAAAFIEKAVGFTESLGGDTREGVIYEPFLKELS